MAMKLTNILLGFQKGLIMDDKFMNKIEQAFAKIEGHDIKVDPNGIFVPEGEAGGQDN